MYPVFEDFGTPLFAALEQQARGTLGDDHPCTRALARAAETSRQADIENAQKHLSDLPPGDMAELMESAHKTLREKPAALLDLWTAPKDPKHKN